MARFYFNYRDTNRTVPDTIGGEFPDLEAARSEAINAVREAISDAMIGQKPDLLEGRYEISDENDWVVAVVPFKIEVTVPLADAQYLVIKRDENWWVVLDGARTGPYQTEKEAIYWAITTAKTHEKAGKSVEVAVDEPTDGVPVVYRSRPT